MTRVESIDIAKELNEVIEICEISTQKLGISERYSFIVSDDDSTLVECSYHCLKNIKSKSVFVKLLKKYVSQYHKTNQCGTRSLLSQLGIWVNEMRYLLDQGIPCQNIIDDLHHSIEQCNECLKDLRNVVNLSSGSSRDSVSAAFLRLLGYHSRHMNYEYTEVRESLVRDFCRSLSHTNNADLLAALENAVVRVWLKRGHATDTDWARHVITLAMPGPETPPIAVREGIWLPVSTETGQLIKDMQLCKHKMWIINGDISRTYRHTGHHESLPILSVGTADSLGNEAIDDWLQTLLMNITKYSVTCIVSHGPCDPDVKHDLQSSHGVIIIDQIPYRTLTTLAESLEVDMMVYPDDACKNTLSENVTLQLIEDTIFSSGIYCTLRSGGVNELANNMITVTISSTNLNKAQATEETFMHNLHRIRLALDSQHTIPGSGETEKRCASALEAASMTAYSELDLNLDHGARGSRIENCYTRPLVMQAVALGLRRWADAVERNLELAREVDEPIREKRDDSVSKLSGWRTALQCLSAFLSSDSLLRTGLDVKTTHRQSLPRDDIL